MSIYLVNFPKAYFLEKILPRVWLFSQLPGAYLELHLK